MNERNRLAGSVIPFARRWHVIHELDLARLTADHTELRALCDQLESCADALPARPPAGQADMLCAALGRMVERHQRDEDHLIGAMFARDAADPLTAALMAHVRRRHAADVAHAADLIAALSGDIPAPPETLGYMLRCFFDGCRRAMDFAELAILMLGACRLTPEARDLLASGLCQRAGRS